FWPAIDQPCFTRDAVAIRAEELRPGGLVGGVRDRVSGKSTCDNRGLQQSGACADDHGENLAGALKGLTNGILPAGRVGSERVTAPRSAPRRRRGAVTWPSRARPSYLRYAPADVTRA